MPAIKRFSNDDVLEAAEQLFVTQSYGETSLRQLIAASHMSPTAFYARYASKEAVLEALVGRMLTNVLTVVSTAFGKAASLEAGFDVSADAIVEGLSAHRPLMRLALTEAATLETLRRTLGGLYTALAGLTTSYLSKQIRKGRAAAADPTNAGWAMVGAVLIHVMRWAVLDELDDAQLAVELRTTARFLLHAVRATA